MPKSKRVKKEGHIESLADWFEEHMPPYPGADPNVTTGGQRSQDAWDLACDLFPVIERLWIPRS